MTVLQQLLSGNNGAIISQLASQFGLDERMVASAAQQLVPALTRGIQRNTADESGLAGLLGALQQGNHARYVEQPQQLSAAETRIDGNNILGHIFGNKEVSRQVASRASEQTGLDNGLLKQMLPVLASAVMGILSKETTQSNNSPLAGLLQAFGGSGAAQPQAPSGMLGMLNGFLDADKDGSALDDIIGMLAKRSA